MRLPWGLRWWELVPEVALGLGLGLFFLVETDAALSAFESTTAIVLMAVTALGWLAARVLLLRFTEWPAARAAVFAVAALVVLRVVVYPAFDDKTVVESLPAAAPVITTDTTTPTTLTPTTAPTPATTAELPVPEPAPQPESEPAPEPEPAPSTEPVVLRSAELVGIDHDASGTARIYRQTDGSLFVGLEDIDIQPGPDYDVYVVPGAGREDVDGGVRLDDLRGNRGTQYYPVPGDVDVATSDWTVLVWCQTFDVPVAAATPV